MATIIKAKGGKKTKNPQAREEFNEGKKIGRPKQVWVWDVEPCDDGVSKYNGPGIGHWERA